MQASALPLVVAGRDTGAHLVLCSTAAGPVLVAWRVCFGAHPLLLAAGCSVAAVFSRAEMQTSTMGKAVKAALVDGGECAAAASAAVVAIAPMPFLGVLGLLCYTPACQTRQPWLDAETMGCAFAGETLVAGLIGVGDQDNFIFGATTTRLLVSERAGSNRCQATACWGGAGRGGAGWGNHLSCRTCLAAAAALGFSCLPFAARTRPADALPCLPCLPCSLDCPNCSLWTSPSSSFSLPAP